MVINEDFFKDVTDDDIEMTSVMPRTKFTADYTLVVEFRLKQGMRLSQFVDTYTYNSSGKKNFINSIKRFTRTINLIFDIYPTEIKDIKWQLDSETSEKFEDVVNVNGCELHCDKKATTDKEIRYIAAFIYFDCDLKNMSKHIFLRFMDSLMKLQSYPYIKQYDCIYEWCDMTSTIIPCVLINYVVDVNDGIDYTDLRYNNRLYTIHSYKDRMDNISSNTDRRIWMHRVAKKLRPDISYYDLMISGIYGEPNKNDSARLNAKYNWEMEPLLDYEAGHIKDFYDLFIGNGFVGNDSLIYFDSDQSEVRGKGIETARDIKKVYDESANRGGQVYFLEQNSRGMIIIVPDGTFMLNCGSVEAFVAFYKFPDSSLLELWDAAKDNPDSSEFIEYYNNSLSEDYRDMLDILFPDKELLYQKIHDNK